APPARMPPAAMRIQARRFSPMDWLPPSRTVGSPPPQGPVDVALGLLPLERLALIERLAAPGDAELDLGDPLLEVQRQRDQGESFLARLDPQLVDLAAVEQQLAGPLGHVVHSVGLDVFRDVA